MFSLETGTIVIFYAMHQNAHISNSLVSSRKALWYLLSVVTFTRKVSGVASYPISPFSHSVSFALRDIGKLPNIIWSIGQTLSNIDISRHNIISYVCSLKAIAANKFTAWISIAVFCQFSGSLNARKITWAIVIREVLKKVEFFSWILPLGTSFHFPFQINPIGAENSVFGAKNTCFFWSKKA